MVDPRMFVAVCMLAGALAVPPSPVATAFSTLMAGLVMGHVFVRRGIVAAMWAHAGGDCAIQIIGPLTG